VLSGRGRHQLCCTDEADTTCGVCIFAKPRNAHPHVIQEGDTVVLGLRVPACKVQSNATEEMERLGVKLSHNPHPSVDPGKLTIMHGSSIAHQDTRVVGEVLTTLAPSATDTIVDAMMNFRNSTGEPLGHPYDIVRRRRSVGGGAGVEKPAVVLRRLAGCEVAKGEEAGGKRRIKKILKFSTAKLSWDFTGSAEIRVTKLCT
jgi:hypothetical protein